MACSAPGVAPGVDGADSPDLRSLFDAAPPDAAPPDLGPRSDAAATPSPIKSGRGIFVWNFFPTSAGPAHADPPDVVAQRAADLGLSFVLIKSGEDEGTWDWNLTASIVEKFTARGLDVVAWNYVRPGNVAAKIAAIAAQAKIPGVKAMILDTEWEWLGNGADAIALCDGIRASVPGVFLGYNPQFQFSCGSCGSGTPVYFSNFPWREFDGHCGDAMVPQVYWDQFTNQDVYSAWRFVVDGATKLGLHAPIWSIQDFYTGATTRDLDGFFALAGDHASLWRWPDPGSSLDMLMGQINWKARSGPASLGTCGAKGYWCGKSAGAPAAALANSLYFCPAPGADWYVMNDCATCYTCPGSVPDTCDSAAATAQSCH